MSLWDIVKKGDSSLDSYNKKKSNFKKFKKKPTSEDIKELLEIMKVELIIDNDSPLLAAVYNKLSESEPRESDRKCEISVVEAWYLLVLLPQYMEDSLSIDKVENFLKYFLQPNNPASVSSQDVLKILKRIETIVIEQRKRMYSYFTDNDVADNRDTMKNEIIAELARKEIDDKIGELIREAEEKKKVIIAQAETDKKNIIEAARRQSEDEKKSVLDLAQQQANEIIYRASLMADKKIAEANKRVLEISTDKRLSEYHAAQKNTEQQFAQVREALVKANESIRCLEDSFTESVTKKAYTQLLELYNLIADIKDSTDSIAKQTGNVDLENASYNMDTFLEMLSEYLADYGIQTISSRPGEPFSVKNHMVAKKGLQYDPRTARIACSLRNGFAWGETVLQKEKVEIQEDKACI